MGFFSKLWKKVKKGFKGIFKGIGKGLKKLLKGFGKFMGKIGIVGQLAMSFVLPGIGAALSKTAGSLFTKTLGALAKGGKIAKAAGKMLQAGSNFVKMGHSAFKTVTDGVSSFVTEMGQATLSNIPGIKTILPDIKHKSFKAAWNNVEDEFMKNTGKVVDNFNNLIGRNVSQTTAGQAALLDKAKAVTGEGISGTAETSSFDSFKPTETPAAIETVPGTVELPKNFGMETPEFTIDKPTVDIKLDPPKVERSLLDKAVGVVKDTAGSIVDEVKQAPYKIPEYAGEMAEDAIKAEVTTAIVGEEQPVEEEYASSGYVMPYEEVTVGQYQSQAINDRAYQMAVDPVGYGMQNPFGYPAQDFYKQQMLAFTRPQPIGQ
jgi:hypothetical protein